MSVETASGPEAQFLANLLDRLDTMQSVYQSEREKRLRPDGTAQFQQLSGTRARLLADPFTPAEPPRAAIHKDVNVLIIGGGFGGLLVGSRLRQAGVDDIHIVEQGGDFGGTWYWNRYPGAACDIESYIYLPLLEETGYMPTAKYVPAPEIYAHCKRIGEKFDLYRAATFQVRVTESRWNEQLARWVVRTDRDDVFRARFVVMTTGFMNTPKLPGIPGIDDFKGHYFHSSRWDYNYSGGSPEGGLVGLQDKRVGVIGSGATAVQIVPQVGAWAKHLYVFQRTPSGIDVRANAPTDPEWFKSLAPGWQQERIENFSATFSGQLGPVDLVSDRWTDVHRNVMQLMMTQASANIDLSFQKVVALAKLMKMEEVRERVDAIVADKATAAALKPYYDFYCKRPCFHDEYLQTFNRPNVTLVDTGGKGVERITSDEVIVGGKAYPVDCLIYASGFETSTSFSRRVGFETHGREGVALSDSWKDGRTTLYGIHTRGFPNCLFVTNAQAAWTPNLTFLLNEHSKHLAYVVAHCIKKGVRTIEPTSAAQEAWVESIVQTAKELPALVDNESCTPGEFNHEGMWSERIVRDGSHPMGPIQYIRMLEAWRDAGQLEGLEVT